MHYATQQLEKYIRAFLTIRRANHPNGDYTVTMLVLYTVVEKAFGSTAAQFNKAVGDMKKAGVIGTARGGEVVFLSNAAWEMHKAAPAVNS